MQIKWSMVLLGFVVLMIALAGCSSNGNSLSYTKATILSGTVVTPKGVAVPSSTLTFFLNGTSTAVGSQSAASTFSFGVSSGTYID